MNSAATELQKQLPRLKIVVFDIFQPLYDLVKSPSDHGEDDTANSRKTESQSHKINTLYY
ncbi:hypothetical protein KY290_021042 [Solanum tuberosum]|uniref:Uncharacterized protein n=1 Tax=Solanum tuberosum TaxID=4113 RepID=A0ABQ7V0F7_SOLTU|nr:hypothetical protein KY289_020225 [Solanum tuberosum]KAH0692890.1 hypothetical protein KY285_019987 [Solanum tuberosum]KAH0757549.1 hypothetical protein KY290_021042 [Solanum tuberosum]